MRWFRGGRFYIGSLRRLQPHVIPSSRQYATPSTSCCEGSHGLPIWVLPIGDSGSPTPSSRLLLLHKGLASRLIHGTCPFSSLVPAACLILSQARVASLSSVASVHSVAARASWRQKPIWGSWGCIAGCVAATVTWALQQCRAPHRDRLSRSSQGDAPEPRCGDRGASTCGRVWTVPW